MFFLYLSYYFLLPSLQNATWVLVPEILQIIIIRWSVSITIIFDKIQNFADLGIYIFINKRFMLLLTFQKKRSCREKYWHRSISSLFELFIQKITYAYFFNTRKNPDYFFFFFFYLLTFLLWILTPNSPVLNGGTVRWMYH